MHRRLPRVYRRHQITVRHPPPPNVTPLSNMLKQSQVHLMLTAVLVTSALQETIVILIYLNLRRQVHTIHVPTRLSKAPKLRQQVHTFYVPTRLSKASKFNVTSNTISSRLFLPVHNEIGHSAQSSAVWGSARRALLTMGQDNGKRLRNFDPTVSANPILKPTKYHLDNLARKNNGKRPRNFDPTVSANPIPMTTKDHLDYLARTAHTRMHMLIVKRCQRQLSMHRSTRRPRSTT